MGYDDEALVGVRGWLLVFVISFGLLGPIAQIGLGLTFLEWQYGVFGMSEGAWRSGHWSVLAVLLIVSALIVFVVWRLLKRRVWRSVQIAIAGVWLTGFGPLCVYCSMALGHRLLTSVIDDAMELGRMPLLYAVGWTVYFIQSRRVANTYPTDEELAVSAQAA
jgi:hypothetical protein